MFDYPTPLTGDTRRDLERLWEELFRLIEELRLQQEELKRKGGTGNPSPTIMDGTGNPSPTGFASPSPYGDQR